MTSQQPTLAERMRKTREKVLKTFEATTDKIEDFKNAVKNLQYQRKDINISGKVIGVVELWTDGKVSINLDGISANILLSEKIDILKLNLAICSNDSLIGTTFVIRVTSCETYTEKEMVVNPFQYIYASTLGYSGGSFYYYNPNIFTGDADYSVISTPNIIAINFGNMVHAAKICINSFDFMMKIKVPKTEVKSN